MNVGGQGMPAWIVMMVTSVLRMYVGELGVRIQTGMNYPVLEGCAITILVSRAVKMVSIAAKGIYAGPVWHSADLMDCAMNVRRRVCPAAKAIFVLTVMSVDWMDCASRVEETTKSVATGRTVTRD